VTQSVAVYEAETWVKSMYMTKSWWKTKKERKYGNQRNFYI